MVLTCLVCPSLLVSTGPHVHTVLPSRHRKRRVSSPLKVVITVGGSENIVHMTIVSPAFVLIVVAWFPAAVSQTFVANYRTH